MSAKSELEKRKARLNAMCLSSSLSDFSTKMQYAKNYEESMEKAKILSDLTKDGKTSDFLVILVNYFKHGTGLIEEIKFDRENNKISIRRKNHEEWDEYEPDELWVDQEQTGGK